MVAGKSPRKEAMGGSLTFTFKLLESVGLGFPIIAMIFGDLSEESVAQITFYYSDCIQQGQFQAKPSGLWSNPGTLQARGATRQLATTNTTLYPPSWKAGGNGVYPWHIPGLLVSSLL